MARFVSCVGRNACNEDGTHCRACGRSHKEVNTIRYLTSELTDFIQQMEYENPEVFMTYIKDKVEKKLKNRKE